MRYRSQAMIACLLLATIWSNSLGGDRPSHVVISDWFEGVTDPSLASEMLQRLRSAIQGSRAPMDQSDAVDQLLDLLQKNDFEGLQRMLGDPRMQEQLRQIRPDDPAFRQRVEERARRMAEQGQNFDTDKLQQMLQRLQAPPTGRAGFPANPPTDQTTTPPAVPRTPPLPPGRTAGVSPPTPPTMSPSGTGSPEDSRPSERFREFLRRAERWLPESFRRSEAVERFRENLTRVDSERGDRPFRLPGNLRLDWEWRKSLSRSIRWTEGALDRVRLGRMPSVQLPDLGRAPSVPTLGGGGLSGSLNSAGIIFGVIGAVLLAFLVAWNFQARYRRVTSSASASAQPTWPVSPRRIATRHDLVRAFDYLTIWRVGPNAAPWHHRQRARSLAALDTSHKHEAFRLAEIYEAARYAPPDEAIPEPAMIQARQDLMALAGTDVP